MSPSILVVDDEPVIQQVLEYLLTSKGYMYVKCLTGKDAFAAMSDVEFNLVILDLNLPDIYDFHFSLHKQSCSGNERR